MATATEVRPETAERSRIAQKLATGFLLGATAVIGYKLQVEGITETYRQPIKAGAESICHLLPG